MLIYLSFALVLTAGTNAAGSCGVTKNPPSDWRVVGGSNANHGTWPWQISIRFKGYMHVCGGTIIGDQWILTAAHCFLGTQNLDPKRYKEEKEYYKVRVGDHRINRYDGTEQDHEVSKIYRHPGYVGIDPQEQHDIALIKLSSRILMNTHVQPVCLNDQYGTYDDRAEGCWTTGWGETKGTADKYHLQQLSGKVWTNYHCKHGWIGASNSGWGSLIKNGMVCFGHGHKGACVGDSGGPLVCKKPGTNKYHQVGVTSWGHGDCDVYGKPSVYTRVATYMSWITKTMANN